MNSIDMKAVTRAVAKIEARKFPDLKRVESVAKDLRELPLPPSPIARDAAIRKPLRSHGIKCSGFGHHHFYNND